MEHWDNGVPVVIPIAGTPPVSLRIDKPNGRLTLRTPVTAGTQMPVNTLAHIRVSTLIENGVTYAEISTTDPRIVIDGYGMLMAVADRVQEEGIDPLTALEETLDVWESILRSRTRLSAEAEIGLFGELLLVRALLLTGVSGAGAWRGGFGEEHDFGFASADIEVKTTSTEQRRHWIHGLNQLVPTGRTPLWLLSLQITRGAEHQGDTLPELIDEILTMASGSDRMTIEDNLAGVGWDEAQRDLFSDSWRMRSVPLALRVDDDFPRLTPDLLAKLQLDTSAIRTVTYELDLTDRSSSPDPPLALTTIVDSFRGAAPDA